MSMDPLHTEWPSESIAFPNCNVDEAFDHECRKEDVGVVAWL